MENTPNQSHPAIRFEHIPVVEGKIFQFEKIRPRVLRTSVEKTKQEFISGDLDLLLSEALYGERARIKKFKKTQLFSLSTRMRTWRDEQLWKGVYGGLLQKNMDVDRARMLESILGHWAEEIGGHFNQHVYGVATHMVPWTFNWLLNAASVRNFVPWKMTESLDQRLVIRGEIPHLQRLAQKGTILLVPTHQSNIDNILVGYVIYLMSLPPFAFGGGLNLFSNAILSFFMSGLGAFTVDRAKSNVLYKNLLKNYSTTILKEGVHSVFYPGGGRSRSGGIESKLKLGLLGTGLQAQIENYQDGKPNPNVYIVPMTTSYHFVLEASSLVENYLEAQGKHKFFGGEVEENILLMKVVKFFWKLFSAQAGIHVQIGRPLDVFGNFVDEEGRSIGPNGTTIDPKRWLTTRGELCVDPQRDQEYTRQLGVQLVDRYYKENVVLSSHVVAFSFFKALRRRYPDLDLYRFLRLSQAQRTIPYSQFLEEAESMHAKVLAAAKQGEFHLGDELKTSDTKSWVENGIRQLGIFHDSAIVKVRDGAIWTEDMNLLYYYRNRLSGYGFTLLAHAGNIRLGRGAYDKKGFLA